MRGVAEPAPLARKEGSSRAFLLSEFLLNVISQPRGGSAAAAVAAAAAAPPARGELGWGYYSSNAAELRRRGGRRCGERGRGLSSGGHQRLMDGFASQSAVNRKLVGKERTGVYVFIF